MLVGLSHPIENHIMLSLDKIEILIKFQDSPFPFPESNRSSWAVQSYSTRGGCRETGHLGNPQWGAENFPELWDQGQHYQPLQHHHDWRASQQVGKGSYSFKTLLQTHISRNIVIVQIVAVWPFKTVNYEKGVQYLHFIDVKCCSNVLSLTWRPQHSVRI